MNVVKSDAQRKNNVRFIKMECVTGWPMARLLVLCLIIDTKKIRNLLERSREYLGNEKYSHKV